MSEQGSDPLEGKVGDVVRHSWETAFSDPKAHNPAKYTYLTHSINPSSRKIWQEKFKEMGAYDAKQDIDLLLEPEKIIKKKLVVCSVIEEANPSTYGDAGFILKTPFENILSVEPKDPGVDMNNADEILTSKNPITMTVEDLMRATPSYYINAVTLTGKTDAGSLAIQAVFIKVKKGIPVDSLVSNQIHILAQKLNIPVIEIDDAMPIKDKIQVYKKGDKPTAIAINRGGKRYYWNFEKTQFEVIDQNREPKPMIHEDLMFFKGILDKELTPEMRKELEDQLKSLEEGFNFYAEFIDKFKE